MYLCPNRSCHTTSPLRSLKSNLLRRVMFLTSTCWIGRPSYSFERQITSYFASRYFFYHFIKKMDLKQPYFCKTPFGIWKNLKKCFRSIQTTWDCETNLGEHVKDHVTEHIVEEDKPYQRMRGQGFSISTVQALFHMLLHMNPIGIWESMIIYQNSKIPGRELTLHTIKQWVYGVVTSRASPK